MCSKLLVSTCWQLCQVTPAFSAQAADMELFLTLVTQNHGSVTELAQGKVRSATHRAAARVMVKIMNHVPTPAAGKLDTHTCLLLPCI